MKTTAIEAFLCLSFCILASATVFGTNLEFRYSFQKAESIEYLSNQIGLYITLRFPEFRIMSTYASYTQRVNCEEVKESQYILTHSSITREHYSNYQALNSPDCSLKQRFAISDLGKLISDDDCPSDFSDILVQFPKHDVRFGDTWTVAKNEFSCLYSLANRENQSHKGISIIYLNDFLSPASIPQNIIGHAYAVFLFDHERGKIAESTFLSVKSDFFENGMVTILFSKTGLKK